ncbi:MAG: hypothetical protein IJO76_07745, partial [Clostridia bacterium]|nr:hypothetical protein [Clostridia bacterium]
EGEALGHKWDDATCTTPKTCSVCGETEGEALGHEWDDATCTAPKTCSVCGATEGEALGHEWDDATCTTAKTCKVCGETEGEALGHDYNAATCTKAKTCKVCGETEGEALGHDYNAATCTKAKTCKVCGETEGKALGHNYAAATCTTAKTCKVCGETSGKALGHSYANATCTKAKTCKTCGATSGKALGHNYAAATCTKAKTCKTCGVTSGKALGHNYAAATCTKAKTCKTCGVTSGSKLGHSYETTTTKATLSANGSVVKKCTVCSYVSSKSTISKVKSIAFKKATTTYDGKTKTPSVVVKDANGKTLKLGTDYTVTYPSAMKKIGTYKVKVTMKGNYSGTKTLTYKINAISVSTCKVSFKAPTTTYNGKVKTPTVVVKNASGKTLKKGTDYTVTYPSGMKNAGTYKVKVTMKGNYSGTKTLTYKINPISVSTCKVSFKKATTTYDGKVKKPSVVVKNASGTTLKLGVHYKVVYPSGMKKVGTYKVKIVMLGNYSGTKTLTYTIKKK